MAIVGTLILVLALIALAFWLVGRWLGRGEDLTVFDHPVDATAWDRFADPAGPSAEHRAAEDEIRAMGTLVRGRSRREMLQFTRQYMEDIPAGRDFVHRCPGRTVPSPCRSRWW